MAAIHMKNTISTRWKPLLQTIPALEEDEKFHIKSIIISAMGQVPTQIR
jgi:hypothetical protein